MAYRIEVAILQIWSSEKMREKLQFTTEKKEL